MGSVRSKDNDGAEAEEHPTTSTEPGKSTFVGSTEKLQLQLLMPLDEAQVLLTNLKRYILRDMLANTYKPLGQNITGSLCSNVESALSAIAKLNARSAQPGQTVDSLKERIWGNRSQSSVHKELAEVVFRELEQLRAAKEVSSHNKSVHSVQARMDHTSNIIDGLQFK